MRDNPEFSSGLIEPLDTASAALEGVLDVLPGAQEHVEVSAIIPCLNEERTLGICIEKIQRAFASAGIRGEIVVGDNGSSDASIEIAMRMGARVAHQPVKGYGAALQAAANAARGRYLVMADADDSYDWSDIPRFVAVLREGADLVMGDRFAGGIEAGAMPALHRYFGNPVLSAIGRVAHATPVRDFHCGMRGFTREAYRRIAARSPGMEFASEMVINAQRAGLAIAEVPIRLYPDKRDRRPHLRSFRDGWRHLRLIVAHAPDRLYLAPGLALMLVGLVGLGVLARGPVTVAGQYFGIHWVALSTMATLIGLSAILLGTLAKVAIATYQPLSRGQLVPWLLRTRPVEALIATGAGLAGLGILADGWLALHWLLVGGGMEASVHLAFILTTACVAGVTMVLAGFVLKLLLDNLSYRDA